MCYRRIYLHAMYKILVYIFALCPLGNLISDITFNAQMSGCIVAWCSIILVIIKYAGEFEWKS